MARRFFIQTYGCQMNANEAGIVRTILESAGYEATRAEADADVLLMMTCSVREHAEQRALGRLAAFRAQKERRGRGTVIGVLGCMAQNLKERLVEEQGADIVVGPDQYRRLPELIEQAAAGVRGLVATELTDECYDTILPRPASPVSALVTVMRGCNNYCTYCIVPYVKGRERSRPPASIIAEIRELAQRGIKEVTLLGQNVLAYRYEGCDFPGLLRQVAEIPGILRVRFLTSHPRDLDERLLECLQELPKVCPSLHLPLQSGSDRVLRLMNRGYTRAEYLQKIDLVRRFLPAAALSTDILVGFPAESEDDFAATLAVVAQVRFDFAYMFRYSPRPGTTAVRITPQVPAQVAGERLSRLINLQNRITRERNEELVGKEVELLVEAEGPAGDGLRARTATNKVVILTGPAQVGELVLATVTQVRGWTPIAKRLKTKEQRANGGERFAAAPCSLFPNLEEG